MFDDDSLAGSWTALADRLDARAALPAWGRAEPALAGFERPGDVVHALAPGCNLQAADEVLGGLIRIAASDDDALLLVLHLLAPTLLALAAELEDLDPDVLPILIGEMACQVRGWGRRGRSRACGANLRWETRRAVLAELHPHVRRYPELGCDLTPDGELRQPDRPVAGPGDEPDPDVVELLVWAVDRGVPAADVRLLVATECARAERDLRADARVAAAHGLCTRTLYRRRARTIAALRIHAAEYLRAVA